MCRVRVPWWPLIVAVLALHLAGCAGHAPLSGIVETDERQCLARVMFFESLRSSDDGMLAVGTVVMNRIASGRYPGTICGVVGQQNQFAPGALTLPFHGQGHDLALHVADEVIAGRRHPSMDGVMFFHTAGYHFPYHNMRYVLVAGGNAFYYKASREQMMAEAARGETDPMPQPVQRTHPQYFASVSRRVTQESVVRQEAARQDAEPQRVLSEQETQPATAQPAMAYAAAPDAPQQNAAPRYALPQDAGPQDQAPQDEAPAQQPEVDAQALY